MEHRHMRRQRIMVGLALSLGLVFVMSLLAGLALAQGPGGGDASLPGVGAPGAILATASITGRVTLADGTPVAAGTVWIPVYDGVSQVYLGGVPVGPGGYYSVTVTSPYDNVKIKFVDAGPLGTADEWYNDKVFLSTADAVDISAGGVTTGVNASLEKMGVITGTVTLDGGGPAVGVNVVLYNAYKAPVSGGFTDASGRYAAPAPYPGTHAYLVEFNHPSIVTEWYQDQGSLDAATPVTVSAGTTVTVDADVTAAGWITGVVTDEVTALPIDAALVSLYDQSDDFLASTNTAPSGAYSLGRLAAGYYKVRFGKADYVPEYYDDQATLSQATLVSVTAGMTMPNVSAALTPVTTPVVPPTGVVTGTVTKNGGSPLAGGDWVTLIFYDAATSQQRDSLNLFGQSTYATQVSSGTYKVLFYPKFTPLAPEWYSDTTSMASADVVAVTTGMTTTDVNADLVTATGCISGVVTTDGGGVIPGATARIQYAGDPSGSASTGTGTDPNGVYQQCGLKGDYQLRFDKNPYIPEWYDDAYARTDATTVTVSNGVTSTANATMTLGGCVSGQVTDLSGSPRTDATGWAYDSAGSQLDFYPNGGGGLQTFFDTGPDGSFVLCGFPTGNYTIRCGVGTAEYLQGSVPVTITAGQGTSGVTCVVARHLYMPIVMRNNP